MATPILLPPDLGKSLSGWPASAPSRQSGIGGVEGHNQKDISFARFGLATTCPGSPGLPVPS
jgi:hypothetical protein